MLVSRESITITGEKDERALFAWEGFLPINVVYATVSN
jgi:hypothetical protein